MFIGKNMVDILVIRYNTPEKDKACFTSLIDHTHYKPHTILFYDNSYSNINLSLLWNYFMVFSQSEYFVLLNNDTRVTDGWLDKMMETMLRDPKVGAVGPSTDRTGNPHQLKTIKNGLPREVNFNQYSPGWQLDGFCLLIRKKAWGEAGGFNADYPFFGQESELLFLMQQLGYKTIHRTDAFVHHDHHASALRAGMSIEGELSKAGKLYWAKVKEYER